MPYTCPVCGYPKLRHPPEDYLICPSCGTEFEYHDALVSHEELRRQWVNGLAPWHSTVVVRPIGWNPWLQLIQAGYGEVIPQFVAEISLQANVVIAPEALLRHQNVQRNLIFA